MRIYISSQDVYKRQDIDGYIYIKMVPKALEGKYVKVKIIDSKEYDLIGEVVE